MTHKTLAHTYFDQLVDTFLAQYTQTSTGRMLSAPALKMNARVAAFYSPNQEMVFRLGNSFDPTAIRNVNIHVFRPLKNLAPLKDWFVVPFSAKEHWPQLTEQALLFTLDTTQAA